MKRFLVALLCALPMVTQAELTDHSTQVQKVSEHTELASQRQLLIGAWQCQSSPEVSKEYGAEVSATYHFFADGLLKVSKTSKVHGEQGEGLYQVHTDRRWHLHQEKDLLLISERYTALTHFESQNVDPIQAENIRAYAKSVDAGGDMIIEKLDETSLSFGYTNGIVIIPDVFRCQRASASR